MSINEKKLRRILREEAQAALSDDSTRQLSPADDKEREGLGSALQKGLVKGGTRFVTKKGLKFTLMQALEFAAKTVPGFGNLYAFADAGVTFLMLLKDLKGFTDELLKVSKVELSGIHSILGEYSIFEASPEDMRKVAEGLRKNMTEEQRLDLDERWGDIMDGMKEVIVDLLLVIKEFSAYISVGVAIGIKLAPIEAPIKDIFFKAVKFLNSQPEAVQMFIKSLGHAGPLTMFIPAVRFFQDYERVSAFIEIDEVITKEVDPGRARALKAARSMAQKGTEFWKYVDTAGEEIADAMASGFTLESKRGDRILAIESEIRRIDRQRRSLRG